jgi:DNA-binding beta-propeller fold protein YncE
VRRLLPLPLLVFAACLHQNQETVPGAPTPGDEAGPELVAPAAATITQLAGPESVLYDPDQDVYFISNINGGLLERDGNGFISRVDPGTMRVELRWLEGLDAPKGMAVAGDSLYVSDIGVVRRFDRRTGASRGVIALPGSTLVNDLTTDGSAVYVSDTGVRPAAGITFAPTGTDAIWKIRDGRAERIAAGRELHQPNGIDWVDGQLYVATFGADEVYRLDGNGRKDAVRLPRGQLDGLVHLPDGRRLVSSWIGNAVYAGSPVKGEFVAVLRGLEAPADLGYDSKRNLLLVPNSPANQVTVHAIPAP